MSGTTRIAFYSPANLNTMDGSSIWVQSVAETLGGLPAVQVVLPLKVPERRDLISGPLRSLAGVEVVPPERFRRRVPPSGLELDEVLDGLEALDREAPFAAFVVRSFEACLAASRRERFRGRLWSTYILEPERDLDSAAYLAEMTAIAEASAHVVCQSEEMRALFETVVPAGRGRTILLPPAIPDGVARADPASPVARLLYTGKFHPFYNVPETIDIFGDLRARRPGLEFHVVGDKIWRSPRDRTYALELEARLTGTPGLTWHGAISRAAVADLLAVGGIALSVWDHRHGSHLNDLVVSTKLLDYCAAGLPVVLNRTVAQEAILGADYPLFVDGIDEVEGVLGRVLDDPGLYRAAAERTWSASRPYTYPAVRERLAPFFRQPVDPLAVEAALLDRPKLVGAALNIGLRLADGAGSDARSASVRSALGLLDEVRALDARFRLVVHGPGGPDLAASAVAAAGADPELAARVTAEEELDLANWLRTIGWLAITGEASAERDVAVRVARAAGAVPVVRAASGPGDDAESSLVAWEPGRAARRIVEVVRRGGWPGASLAARRRAAEPGAAG